MRNSIALIGLFILSVSTQNTSAQNNKQKAIEMGTAAIKLMDSGKIDESIKLLEDAKKLDPDNLDIPYEMAYAYQLKKDYKKAIKITEWLVLQKDVTDQMFQLMGNCHDLNGQSGKAMEAYEAGVKKFPNSGRLYLEMGVVQMALKEYNKALDYFETGIYVDPDHSSNYYWAAKIYCNSSEEFWGMIYGEIFMNLERNSKRTQEISKMLYDVYKSEIKFTNETGTEFSVSFSKNATIDVSNISDPSKVKLPYGVGVYEPTLMMALIGENTIDINSLDRIRKKFIEVYFKNKSDKDYPNVLFDYVNNIMKAGHLETYNHWILMKGSPDDYDKWYDANKTKWDDFVKWFNDNPLVIDDKNRFYSGQYD